jgi:hypothetical protein
MKLPRGFGKNYFTLRAITATTNQVTMHAQCSRVQSFHMTHFASEELEAQTEEEELAATALLLELSSKPCQCNCYFKKRTRKSLKLHAKEKVKPQIFVTLNTSISPPFFYSAHLWASFSAIAASVAQRIHFFGRSKLI